MNLARLKNPAVGSLWVGVAIRRNLPRSSRHTGIVYRSIDDRLHMVHMAWHNRLIDEDYDTDFLCAEPQLDPILAESFADYCCKVAGKSAGRAIPYNLLRAYPNNPMQR
jgi:hypothetical protein